MKNKIINIFLCITFFLGCALNGGNKDPLHWYLNLDQKPGKLPAFVTEVFEDREDYTSYAINNKDMVKIYSRKGKVNKKEFEISRNQISLLSLEKENIKVKTWKFTNKLIPHPQIGHLIISIHKYESPDGKIVVDMFDDEFVKKITIKQ